METPEKKIERLEAALKTAKLKIWVISVVGILMAISLSVTIFFVGINLGERTYNIPVIPQNTLEIPLGTPPTGFGRRIIDDEEILAVEEGFANYQTMLNEGSVIIPNGTQPPVTFPLNSLYSKFEYISVEALAQMLKKGQISGTTGTIQPAFIRIQDCRILDLSGTPIIKKYLMMVDGNNNLIRDGGGKAIYYNELRRCPSQCNVTDQ